MPQSEIKNALASIELKVTESIKAVNKEVAENGKASEESVKTFNDALAKQEETMKGISADIVELFQKNTLAPAAATVSKSLGQRFIESSSFKGLTHISSGVNLMANLEQKAITLAAGSAGALVTTTIDPTLYVDARRSLRIRDLITTMPVGTGVIEYMRQDVFTNNAGPQENEFDTKNESNITWELIETNAKTIAHWIPASRQVLADAPQLQGLIDIDLRYGLQLESDRQLLLGDGTAGNMTGLMVDSAIPTVGQLASGTTVAEKAGAMIDHIRSAITVPQTNEYSNMTGIVLNPIDWEVLETAKATDGHYLMIQFPAEGANERLWRMPVVITNAMPVDNFILGDWMMGAKIYDRESVEIRVSESHADYFVKNGVAILAEERYVLAIQRPKAFCKGLFTIAP